MSITLAVGMSGTYLDLFVKAGPVLYNPSTSPTYVVKDANNFVQGSGYGHNISTGHYDARNFIIPSSGTAGIWTIAWSVGSTTKNETFTVAAPTLTNVGDEVNDIDKMIENIRIDIGDFNGDIFSTVLLEKYLEKAVMRLNRVLGISSGKVRPTGITPGGLGTPARIPAISINLDERTVYPDNDEIKDIIVLQSEILISKAEMAALRRASAAGAAATGADLIAAASGSPSSGQAGIMIRNADGVTIDTKSAYGAWISNKVKLFLEESKSKEIELEKALLRLQFSFSSNFGKVVF